MARWHWCCDSLRPTADKPAEEAQMSRAIRIAVGSAALAAGLAIAGTSTANAQVRVRGSFPLPHGRISVDIGHGGYGGFPIGGYVPYGYDVYEDPDYGYGFAYEDQWIACEPRGSQWIIIAAPVYYGGYRNYGYGRDYRYGRTYRNDRYYSHRSYGDRYYRRDDRNHRRDDRRWRDGRNHRRDGRSDRRDGRNDRRDGGRNRRWNR
jgi:hypothetical protein